MTQLFDASKIAGTRYTPTNEKICHLLNAGTRFAVVFYDSIAGPLNGTFEGITVVAFSGIDRAMVVLANGAVFPFRVFCDACERSFVEENYYGAYMEGILNEFDLNKFNKWMSSNFGRQYRGVVAGKSADKKTAHANAKLLAKGNVYALSAFGRTLRVDDSDPECLEAWLYEAQDASENTFWGILQYNPQSVYYLSWETARKVELEMHGLLQNEHYPTPLMNHCFLQLEAFDAILGLDGAHGSKMTNIVQLLAKLSSK